MRVNHLHVSLTRPGIHGLKNEFLGSRDLQQSQILRRGADEDQIVVPDIIQGKQRPTLYSKLAVEETENPVQFVDRQNLTHPGVMIEDPLAGIGGRVEVTHVRLQTSYKVAVAEKHARRLRSGHKSAPENLVGRRYRLLCSGLASGSPRPQHGTRDQRGDEQHRKNPHGNRPAPIRTSSLTPVALLL